MTTTNAPVLRVLALGILLTAVGFVTPALGVAAQGAPDWSKVRATKIVEDLEAPANIAFAPDGSIWYAEVFKGNVTRFDPDTGEKKVQRTFNVVSAMDERGLIGFALDPDFEKNGHYYVVYTEPVENASLGLNKLVRVEDDKERLLLNWSGAKEHNGGRVLFAPDGLMYVSTGENQARSPAQDPKSLLGKILRATRDGQPVAGNLDGVVFSKGHRNVYGLAYDPDSKQLWATENSGWRRDELNLVVARGNYGYPECEGLGLNGVDTPCPKNKGYIEPIMTFYENRTAAPTGATFWKGHLYWGSLKEGSIHRLTNESGTWKDTIVYDTKIPILDVKAAPDGRLYYADYGSIWRLDFDGDGAPSPTTTSKTATTKESVDGKKGPLRSPGFEVLVVLVGLAAVAFTVRKRA